MSVHHIHLANFLTAGHKNLKNYARMKIREGILTTLETYWKTRELTKLLDENPDIKIFLDSGAHSLLNAQVGLRRTEGIVEGEKTEDGKIRLTAEDFNDRLTVNQRIFYSSKVGGAPQFFADWSFNKSPEVRKYLDNYIAFIHKYKDQLLGYVNLDIIYNAEESWENQKYMEENGLRPIPVFHYGEDFKWLKRYVDNYEYIGIGGVAGGVTLKQFTTSLGDKAFSYITEARSDLKVHGFAVTSIELMKKYPWFSVDSTTWLKIPAYGGVFVPRGSGKSMFDYTKKPYTVFTSDVSLIKRSKRSPHYTLAFSKEEQERIEEYFRRAGADLEKLKTDMAERAKVTIYYFEQLLKSDFIHQVKESRGDRFFF